MKFALLGMLILLSSCYQMPKEDDYCLVPTTNNPTVTCQKPQTNLMPGGTY